jgi:hypothetical protein
MKVGDNVVRNLAGGLIPGTIVREDDAHWYFEANNLPSPKEVNAHLKPFFDKMGLDYPELPEDHYTPYWKFLKTTLHEVDEEIGWDGITKSGSYIKMAE